MGVMSIFLKFKTVKSKMTLVIVLILMLLSVLVIFLSSSTYFNYRALRMESCRSLINFEKQRINNTILELQNNARELALIGELTYRSKDRSYFFVQDAVASFFKINEISIGGGIWFEPYKIDPKRELACVYAFKKAGEVVIDENFESPEYNYPEQMWYKTVQNRVISDGGRVVWTLPYYDAAGTKTLMTTVGCSILDESGKFVGMSTIDWELDSITKRISSIRPTENSFLLFADLNHDYIVLLTDKKTKKTIGSSLHSINWYNANIKDEGIFSYYEERYFYFERTMDNGMMLAICIPVHELFYDIEHILKFTIGSLIAFVLFIALTLYNLLDRFVNKPLAVLAESASQIGDGNLDINLKLDTYDELSSLATAFNRMTFDLREHIKNLSRVTAERERIGTELEIARGIQESMLPTSLPQFPHIGDIQIYAAMTPAMEIGGDFYDFFTVGDDKLAIVIADVSGKGISAALFMVIAKTLIKTRTKLGHRAGDVLAMVNSDLCENNPLGMFVTAFLAILNIRTGELTYANAGHNPPLLKHNGEAFAYMDMKPGLVLGAMDGVKYTEGHIRLCNGDILFAYTDGVTEAENSYNSLFGATRLLDSVNRFINFGLSGLLSCVKGDVDMFAGGAPQSDDITMLAISYNVLLNPVMKDDSKAWREITLPASRDSLTEAISFLESELSRAGCPDDKALQTVTAAEEIFVNIANYSYIETVKDDKTPSVTVLITEAEDKTGIKLRFIDRGTQFNPTEAAEPDITLPAEEREIGGLGILMARKLTDKMEYEYRDGMNILTLTKYF